MSIQSEVNRITANIASAYTAAAEKNAAMPSQQNSKNLAATILSIPAGAELPELTNPGTAANLLAGKQLIDGDGIVVNGSMPDFTGNDLDRIRPSEVLAGYYIQKGYHDGAEKIEVAQRKVTITPKKEPFEWTADVYLLPGTIIDAIPAQYQDVTPVTATAEDVAAGKVFVDATGAVVTGTAESGGGGEYYTFVNNTGIDLIVWGNVVAAGATVDIPVNTEAFSQYGYLSVTSSPINPATPQGSYIVATVDGVVPPLAAKNRIAMIGQPFGINDTYRVYTGNIELVMNTDYTNPVVPDSGSTIVLTLSN